jgi:carbonic anhydrase
LPGTRGFLSANAAYARRFAKGRLAGAPRRKVAIVTCMDARLDPARFLGLEEGDAHVIRNAGGRAADALRSLIISQHLLGTREVLVIHHTDCGILKYTDSEIEEMLEERVGRRADMPFHTSRGLEEAVRDDVRVLRGSRLLMKGPVRGFVYDVKSGHLTEVKLTRPAGRRSGARKQGPRATRLRRRRTPSSRSGRSS